MITLLVGYMWLFIHRPFEVWPWLGELRIERVYMLITLVYWAAQPKAWTKNRLNAAIAVLGAAIFVATLFSPYEGFNSVFAQNWFKLALFYVLLMTSVRDLSDLKILIVAFLAIMGLYELHSLREYLNGRGAYRMDTWRMIGVDSTLNDPNSFAASIQYAFPLLLPASVLVGRPWQKRALWGLLALGVGCILLTGSRTGFAGMVVLGTGFAMMTKYRWRILALLIVAAPIVWANLSQDLKNRYLTLIDSSRGPANAQTSAHLREDYFFMALKIWGDNPLFGVGPQGFAHASRTGQESHSLYAETLSELGSFGVLAVGMVVLGFYRNFRDARQIYRASLPTRDARFCYFVVCATGLTVLQLLFLGLAGHNLFRFTWLWYAAFSALGLRFLQESALPVTDEVHALHDASVETDLESGETHAVVRVHAARP